MRESREDPELNDKMMTEGDTSRVMKGGQSACVPGRKLVLPSSSNYEQILVVSCWVRNEFLRASVCLFAHLQNGNSTVNYRYTPEVYTLPLPQICMSKILTPSLMITRT